MKWLSALLLTGLIAVAGPARAATELTFYYPIAVGGPLTKVIDGNLVSGRTFHDHGRYMGHWIRLLEEARDAGRSNGRHTYNSCTAD